MGGIEWATLLPIIKTASVPLLLLVGKWLKGQKWFSNQVIPYAVLGLNGAGWVLMQMGVAKLTDGSWTPVVPPAPEVLGMGAVAVPLYAGLALALPSWLGAAAGTVASLAVEQFLVNRAHKGIKYRLLYKAAEAAQIIPLGQSKTLRLQSKW